VIQNTELAKGVSKPVCTNPTGKLRIQFHNGTKEVVEVNNEMSFDVIANYVKQ